MKEFESLLSELKNKIYHPVYFFWGSEPYYMDRLTAYMEQNILSDSEKSFNQTIFYGRDTNVINVIESARRFPMMSNYQLVIIKEAQQLKDIEKLAVYLENPMKSTILVINYKNESIDKRTKFYKLLSKYVCVQFEKIRDYQVAKWIVEYLKSKKLSIDPEAAELMADAIGNDLNNIVHEIDKLCTLLSSDIKSITKQHIEKNIGISKDFNNFELLRAIGRKDIVRTNKILYYFQKNPKNHPFIVININLLNYFTKLLMYHYLPDKSKQSVASALEIFPNFVSEYEQAAKKYPPKKIETIVSLLREYDIKSKGIGSSVAEEELLQELIFKIIH